MGPARKRGVIHEISEQQMREQEVLRANKELAAYFKGLRTEREARAALKVIKAFVRERERQDARSRPPLPGAQAPRTATHAGKRKAATGGDAHRAKARRTSAKQTSERRAASADALLDPGSERSSVSLEPTDD